MEDINIDEEVDKEQVDVNIRQTKFPFGIMPVILVVFFIGALLFVAWYFQTQLQKIKSQQSPEQQIVKPILIVGTDPTYPPMEYIENGEMVGYDIDLANFIAFELGMRVEFKNMLFDDLFTALEKKEIDMILASVTITDERKQKYDFSEPYFNAGQVIVTIEENADIKSTADLAGKKIGVQIGTTNERAAMKYTDDQLVIQYADFPDVTKALIAGNIDAMFTDLVYGKGLTLENSKLKIVGDPFTEEYYGVVLRKGDPKVRLVNQVLELFRVKGVLINLKQKWLD